MNKCKNVEVGIYEIVGGSQIALCEEHEKEYKNKERKASSMEIPCGNIVLL